MTCVQCLSWLKTIVRKIKMNEEQRFPTNLCRRQNEYLWLYYLYFCSVHLLWTKTRDEMAKLSYFGLIIHCFRKHRFLCSFCSVSVLHCSRWSCWQHGGVEKKGVAGRIVFLICGATNQSFILKLFGLQESHFSKVCHSCLSLYQPISTSPLCFPLTWSCVLLFLPQTARTFKQPPHCNSSLLLCCSKTSCKCRSHSRIIFPKCVFCTHLRWLWIVFVWVVSHSSEE